ncbi:MAG: polysaccharide deacetylase family protein [Planctomycetota bacterium]|nr:polysaccharide deacetylase family protein [Planctomycetota bacterium]MDA1178506.1 polysaccharide deacetylase family protein [Planctomycetota bacterium]
MTNSHQESARWREGSECDSSSSPPNRRHFLKQFAAASAGTYLAGLASSTSTNLLRAAEPTQFPRAQIAITLDLEMARNFPRWEDTHWDYEKGNLNEPAKRYTVDACRRVKSKGGRIHTFVVGRVFEQENVDWLKEVAAEGHPIGNHTYDHVNMVATAKDQIQYRFKRAPWLIAEQNIADILRENVRLANFAIQERLGVSANGFRTPGGFATGLLGREDVQQMLMELGFSWISCRYPSHPGVSDLQGRPERPQQAAFDGILASMPDAQPFRYESGLWEIPMSPISDIGAFRNGRWQLEYFLEAIQLSFNWAVEHRGVFDFLAHPSCLGVMDPQMKAIDLICNLVEQSSGKAELVTLDTIATRSAELAATTGASQPPEANR